MIYRTFTCISEWTDVQTTTGRPRITALIYIYIYLGYEIFPDASCVQGRRYLPCADTGFFFG